MAEVAFDANGYPYDTSTGQLVNLSYDDQGNAYNANTGEMIDTVIAPDQSTVYKVGAGSGAIPWGQVVQNVTAQLTQPPRVGYYPSHYGYTNQNISPYGVGANVSATSRGLGGSVNISPTTLLIVGVVAFAFFFGKGRR